MCSPAIAIAAASVVGAAGAVASGRAAHAAGVAQKAYLDRKAARAREIGKLKSRNLKREGELMMGKQIALRAATGDTPSEGSALLVTSETAAESRFQQNLALANAEEVAWGAESQGAIELAEGRAKKTAGMYDAGTTLLKGGYSTYKNWSS